MRSFAILLSLQCISNGVVGFSSVLRTSISRSSASSLFAINNDDDVNPKKKDMIDHQLHNKVASIAATLVFGLSIGTTSSIAYDSYPLLPSNKDITVSNNMLTSSSVQVSYSNSDFVDFSLPSYQDVAAAEINSNLSGGKDLLDDKYKTMSPSSNESSANSTPAKKEPTKADIMAEKAAAKAAQAAARERQKAAADAAALDKMIGI